MSSRGPRALERSETRMSTSTGTSTTNAGTGIVAATETFKLHPHAGNVNPSTQEGLKLFLKATEEFPREDKLSLSIENSHVMIMTWLMLE